MLRAVTDLMLREAGDQLNDRLLRGALYVAIHAVAAAQTGESTDAAPRLISEKVCSEAAILLRSVSSQSGKNADLTRLESRLTALLMPRELDQLGVSLSLHPGLALDLALVPLHLRDLGLGDPRLEPLLADLFGAERLTGPERPAHRRLEQLWLHGLWTGSPDRKRIALALTDSALAWEFDHLSGTTDDAYAFTHAILYATDHGRNEADLPRPIEQIEADADAMLAVALDAGNHDLATEMLWTWPMLGLDWSPLAATAHDFLAGIARREGFLPGPGFDQTVCDELPAEQRDLYILQTSYHTTFVHGMLVAAVRVRDVRATGVGWDREVRVGAAIRDRETRVADAAAIPLVPLIADRFAEVLPPLPVSEQWWAYISGLSPERRHALGTAFTAMALRRATATADIGAVHHVLQLAEECNLPMTPPLRQEYLLLHRAMACAQLAG